MREPKRYYALAKNGPKKTKKSRILKILLFQKPDVSRKQSSRSSNPCPVKFAIATAKRI
jgi:hypothetical protein